MNHRTSRCGLWCGALILLALGVLLSACGSKEPVSDALSAPTRASADRAAAKSSGSEATPTTAFRVEVPVTATLEGQGSAREPAGPSLTPTATKTPWPTQAPTSAPVDDPNMVYVPGGECTLGRDGGREDESPQHTLYVDGFNIDKFPVTNADYAAFVGDTGHRAPRHWQEGQVPAGKEYHPVVWVSWEDASAYAQWAGKRLPTEAEWEKAARGTDGRLYPWGNAFDSGRCNSQEAGHKDTRAVDAHLNGVSPFGAMDMSGNVWEWTADWYGPYRGSLYSLERYGTVYRVMRGGSWFDNAESVMAVTRNSGKPSFMFSTIGFRCAK